MQRFRVARFSLPFISGILPYCLTFFILMPYQQCTTAGSSGKTIDRLIADLRSDRFETREAATLALKERIDAIPTLRKAKLSNDLEVRRRVDDILTALERKLASRRLSKSKKLSKDGRAVEIADRLAFAAKWGVAGDEGWEGLTQFADQLITKSERLFPPGVAFHRHQAFPFGLFRPYVKLTNPKELAQSKINLDTGPGREPKGVKAISNRLFLRETAGRLLLRSEEISFMTGRSPQIGLSSGMIAASGDVQISGADSSVIIAGGDVKKVKLLRNCILVCDGNVELLDALGVSYSIIVARGKVTWNKGKKKGKFSNCLIRSGHMLYLLSGSITNEKMINLKDGTPDPLSFVKFFELADVGIAVEDLPPRESSATNGVRIKEVRKESPFANGLRPGDGITALDDKKTPTTEVFRKILRRALAEGGPLITFTVQRAGKLLDVSIPVKD